MLVLVQELEGDAEKHRKSLSAPYAATLLRYSSYKKPQQDRWEGESGCHGCSKAGLTNMMPSCNAACECS